MPRNATLDQRIAWHLAHAEACGCRPIAGKLLREMEARGITVPKPSVKDVAAAKEKGR